MAISGRLWGNNAAWLLAIPYNGKLQHINYDYTVVNMKKNQTIRLQKQTVFLNCFVLWNISIV